MLETLSLMGAGFINAFSPINLLAMVASTALGITIGCLPGLSAAMGVALLLPVTFGMDPATGLIVLGGIYCGAIFGGSISAILIHTPGTPASAATAIEGYKLTLKGQAAKALTVACFASFCGGLLSCISLYFFSPLLAELTMKFKSPEYFWLSIFGLTIIAGVSSRSILKGLMSGILGLLISTIGMDPMEGVERYMFGVSTLYNGVNVTCALIGLFSMSQVLILAEKKIVERAKAAKIKDKLTLTKGEVKRIMPTITRSWIIGNILGILPGAGATIACFMGYNEARRFSKHKEEFGTGSIEGVAGSEAANNAVTGGSLIPTLTLGIPGESVTAVLMGGLIKKMPYTALLFIIGSVAICGIPPFNGFVSEFLIYAGMISGIPASSMSLFIVLVLAIAALGMVGTMAMLCFTKASGIMFLGNPRGVNLDEVSEVPRVMICPMTILAFLAFLIGMFPHYFITLVMMPVSEFVNGVGAIVPFENLFNLTSGLSYYFFIFFVFVVALLIVRKVLGRGKTEAVHTTWGCGYNRANNHMQYTASSYASLFISTLKPLFKRVSHIKKPKELFPKEAYYEQEIQDIEEAYIVKPLINWDEKFLTKFERIQNGNIQQYILFGLVFLILAIIGMVYFGG